MLTSFAVGVSSAKTFDWWWLSLISLNLYAFGLSLERLPKSWLSTLCRCCPAPALFSVGSAAREFTRVFLANPKNFVFVVFFHGATFERNGRVLISCHPCLAPLQFSVVSAASEPPVDACVSGKPQSFRLHFFEWRDAQKSRWGYFLPFMPQKCPWHFWRLKCFVLLQTLVWIVCHFCLKFRHEKKLQKNIFQSAAIFSFLRI